MFGDLASRILGVASPWDPDPQRFIASAREQVPFDGLVLAVFSGRNPQPDEVLAHSGISHEIVNQWCRAGLESLGLFRQACRSGIALASEAQGAADMGISADGDVMLHVLPESLVDQSWWFLLLTNNHRPFTLLEQRIASLLLRHWQVGFNQVQKPLTGRLLIGHDNRLIHADPWTQLMLLEHPEVLGQLTDTLHKVVEQRWEKITDHLIYDFAVELAVRPFWVRFHRDSTTNIPLSQHWFLELHPLEKDELPLINNVDDVRIARALGYIHQNFNHAPDLSTIAEAVQVSPFHFHRLFSRSVGISPKHYLQAKQLQYAKWLLRGSREPVSSIAAKAGFASHGHFSSTFQKVVGMSPTQYRDKHT